MMTPFTQPYIHLDYPSWLLILLSNYYTYINPLVRWVTSRWRHHLYLVSIFQVTSIPFCNWSTIYPGFLQKFSMSFETRNWCIIRRVRTQLHKENHHKMNPKQVLRVFMTYVWNSETKEFMGRTGASWAKIVLFYLTFYLSLAGIFSLLMYVFFLTINYKLPTYYTPSESLLKNPTLVFRPVSSKYWDQRHHHTYNTNQNHTSIPFVSSLEDFLKPYQQAANGSTSALYRDCTGLIGYSADNETKPCLYNLTQALSGFSPPCNQDNQWGWNSGSPCLFLRLNRMISFYPITTQNISAEVESQIEDTYGNL